MKKIIVLAFICSLFLTGCEKQDLTREAMLALQLEGTWVESTMNTDTVKFHPWPDTKVLEVRRRMETAYASYDRKMVSDLYEYWLTTDSITLRNMLSDRRNTHTWFFRLNSTFDEFEAGDFINSPEAATQRLNFRKVK